MIMYQCTFFLLLPIVCLCWSGRRAPTQCSFIHASCCADRVMGLKSADRKMRLNNCKELYVFSRRYVLFKWHTHIPSYERHILKVRLNTDVLNALFLEAYLMFCTALCQQGIQFISSISPLLYTCPLSQDEPQFILSHQFDNYFFLWRRAWQLFSHRQSMASKSPPSAGTRWASICVECVWGKHVNNT